MVFFNQNCSDLLWEKNCSSDLEKLLRSLEQFIQTLEGQNNFGNRMVFWLVPGGFSYLID